VEIVKEAECDKIIIIKDEIKVVEEEPAVEEEAEKVVSVEGAALNQMDSST
jgi:hypothetical protein